MASSRIPREPSREGSLPSGGLLFPGGRIRPWRAADAKPLAVLADDRRVWVNLADRFPHPYTVADARRWIRDAGLRHPATDFAVESAGTPADPIGAPTGSTGVLAGPTGVLAGGIGLLPGEDIRVLTAEVGFWLGPPFWGRGLMTAALGAFTAHAFAALGLRRVFARVLDWNPASARVLEKCGYVLEGRLRRSACKDGKIVDELLYAKVA